MLTNLYNSLGSQEQLKGVLGSYEGSTYKKTAFGLDHSHVTKKKDAKDFNDLLKDFEKLDGFVFELVPVNQAHEGKYPILDQEDEDANLDQYLGGLSYSSTLIQRDDQRKNLYKDKKDAHTQLQTYLDKLMTFDSEEWEEDFAKQRDGIFAPAAEVLFVLNRKGYLSGFNLMYLSMPTEHSLHFNFWCYMLVKLHLKEAQKVKIVADLAQIAHVNDLNVFQLHGASQGLIVDPAPQDGELINISQAPGSGSGGGSAAQVTHSSGGRAANKKCLTVYSELFALLSNSENFERNTKRSLFKGCLQYFEHAVATTEAQQSVLWDSVTKLEQYDKNMNLVKGHLSKELQTLIDEGQVSVMFEEYEIAFENQTKATIIQKDTDNIFTGSGKYLSLLKEALAKDVAASDGQADLAKGRVDFVNKVREDIVAVQTGLNQRGGKLVEALLREVEAQIKTTALDTTKPAKPIKRNSIVNSLPVDSPRKAASKVTKDTFE